MPTQEERYRDVLAKRFNAQGSGVADYSGPVGNGVGREALEEAQMKSVSQPIDKTSGASAEGGEMSAAGKSAAMGMGAQAATSSAAQGNGAGTVGGGLMFAGAASANPYLMAAGLGLQVLGASEQNKRNQQEAQRQAYNERIRNRQEQMARIAQMGIQ